MADALSVYAGWPLALEVPDHHGPAASHDRNLEGRCLNLTTVGWAGGAFSIAEDVFLLVLPIPELWKLQMGRKKKFGLFLLFSLGSL